MVLRLSQILSIVGGMGGWGLVHHKFCEEPGLFGYHPVYLSLPSASTYPTIVNLSPHTFCCTVTTHMNVIIPAVFPLCTQLLPPFIAHVLHRENEQAGILIDTLLNIINQLGFGV